MSLEDIRDADFENQWWPQSVPVHRSRQCWINTGHEPAFPFAAVSYTHLTLPTIYSV